MSPKILTVVYSLGKGGTERAAQNFACAYSDIGCESKLMFTRLDGPRREHVEGQGIDIFSLVSEQDCKELEEWNPNVVHLHSHGVKLNEFEKIHSLLPNAKYIETNVFSRPSPWANSIHISYQLSYWGLWLFRKRSKGQFNSAMVPNPVNTLSFKKVPIERENEFREKYALQSSDLVIGRIGQNFAGKWSTVLLDVFEEQRKDDARVKLLVVNPPDLILERISYSPYKLDIIIIKEIRDDEELAACYSAIDIFILIAEQGESFGMVLAESLLCETPVVTLATPWADNSQGEVVGNRVGGFVVVKKSELSNTIRYILFNESLRADFGSAGRDRIIRNFDSRAVAKKSLDYISDHGEISFTMDPYQLIMDSEGRVDFCSGIILRAKIGFASLKYTLGYSPLYCIIPKLFLFLLSKLKSSTDN